MHVTIGMSAYNLLKYSKDCCETFLEYCTDHPYDFLVVDDCSTDESPAYFESLKSKFPEGRYKYIRFDKNRGAPTAWNEVLKEAKDLAVIINNDIIPGCRFVSNLVNYLEERPEVGVASVHCIDHHNYPQAPTVEHKKDWMAYSINQFKDFDEVGIHGCCIAVTKECFEQVGFFDTRFKVTAYEDCDYVVRAEKAGFLVRTTHKTNMFHYGGITQSYIGQTHEGGNWYQEHNKKAFEEKWNVKLDGLLCTRAVFWDRSKSPAERFYI